VWKLGFRHRERLAIPMRMHGEVMEHRCFWTTTAKRVISLQSLRETVNQEMDGLTAGNGIGTVLG
jgi:hypothetical protein